MRTIEVVNVRFNVSVGLVQGDIEDYVCAQMIETVREEYEDNGEHGYEYVVLDLSNDTPIGTPETRRSYSGKVAVRLKDMV